MCLNSVNDLKLIIYRTECNPLHIKENLMYQEKLTGHQQLYEKETIGLTKECGY